MKDRFIHGTWSLALALSLWAGMPAAAQTAEPSSPAPSVAQEPEKEKEEDVEPGQGKLSEFGEALAQFWSVSSAFQATQNLDDNVFLNNSFRKSDTATKLAGRVTVAYRGPHTRFEASYLPEFNIFQRYKPLNYARHNYVQSLSHDLSRRLALNWQASASQSPSRGGLPFKAINFGGYRFSYYAPEALNDGLNLLNFSSRVGLTYRLRPRWKLIGDIDGAATHFSVRGNPAVSPVSKEILYSVGGSLGAEYARNASQTFGFNVRQTYFGSVAPASHQHLQVFRATFDQRLRGNYRLHLSAGPGITHVQAGDPKISAFFEATLARQLARSGFAFSAERSSQVGLLQDSVTGYGVTARANRLIGRKWTSAIGASYHRSEGAGGTHQLESATGNAQIGYRISNHLSSNLNYGYIHQKNLIPSPVSRNVSRNEVSLGFVYNFGVIAGR